MKNSTEADIILEHTRRWFSETQWSIESFANERLVPALEAADVVSLASDDANDSAEAYQRNRRTVGTRIGRIFRGHPFPLEYKWPWLHSLPKSYRLAAERDLMAMAGCLRVAIPTVSADGGVERTVARMGDVMREFGEFVAASTPAHNGHYDINDNPAAVGAMLKEGCEAIETLYTELCALARGTGQSVPRLRLSSPPPRGD